MSKAGEGCDNSPDKTFGNPGSRGARFYYWLYNSAEYIGDEGLTKSNNKIISAYIALYSTCCFN
jgi:hypothetical protein